MGKEGISEVYCEVSKGQELGWSAEQIPFGKQRSVCKGQNDSCGNATMLARFICQTRPTLKAINWLLSGHSEDCYRQVQAFSDWPSLVTFSPLTSSAQDLPALHFHSGMKLLPCPVIVLFHLVFPCLPSEILRSLRVKQCIETNSKIFTECLSILYIQLKGIQRSLKGLTVTVGKTSCTQNNYMSVQGNGWLKSQIHGMI